MPTHNPDCVHGAAHAYSACRDRYNTPLKMVSDPEPVNAQVADAVVAAGDDALKLLLAAAGNVIKADEPAAPAQ
jgi:hypothetical protein